MSVIWKVLIPAFLAPLFWVAAIHAAEFEVLDRFSVDGYAVLRGSADIPGGSFTVGGSTFVVKDGNVGIGIIEPSGRLSIGDDIGFLNSGGNYLNIGGAGSNVRINIGQDSTHALQHAWVYNAAPTDAYANITTYGYNNPLRIDAANIVLQSASGGNVGIGTTNPVANLDVNGGIKVGTVTASCTSAIAGTLRWYDGHMSVCNGANWRQLDNQPPPTLTSITPTSGLYNRQTAITVIGTGFSPGLELSIGGVTATSIVLTGATQITAATPMGSVGTQEVKITNTDGQYITGAFTYNALPAITSVSPNSGLKATAVTITGTGFVSGAAVTIGDADAAGVWVSATQITATTPSNSFINAKDVKVTNPDTGSVTLTNGFTYFAGTGGTITTAAGYRVHTFTSGGTFTVNIGGNVEVLVVAGGGGGGSDRAGGGGGGGLIYNASYAVSAGPAITVTVGAGGLGATNDGQRGGTGDDSVFGTLTAKGGGGGGSETVKDGLVGGSGGGADYGGVGGGGTSGQGNSGGTGTSNPRSPGGGGGAGGAGQNGNTNVPGPAGGIGLQYFGSYYSGGGGAGDNRDGLGTSGPGNGGLGGGGQGGLYQDVPGQHGTAGGTNTGGGGGGGGYSDTSDGGAGGSGIVIIRYPN